MATYDIATHGGTMRTLSNPLTLTAFSVDMKVDNTTSPADPALQSANLSDPSKKLSDHAENNKILNALTINDDPHVPKSVYVEFLWSVSGNDNAKFKCQVNFEEIGAVTTHHSLDVNVLSSSLIDFAHGKTDYKDVIKVDIGTAGGQLLPSLYTVSALFFSEMDGSTALGAFVEVGKIMVS